MNYIPKNISNSILTIGPDYQDNKGGIGAVIEIYSKYFESFKFLASYRVGDKFFKLVVFVNCLFKLFIRLILDRKISIIHIHGASNGSFWRKRHIINISKLFNKKIAYHIHGGGFKDFYSHSRYKNRILKTLHKCDVIVALSEQWKEYFIVELDCKNVIVINNIIAEPRIEKSNKLNNHSIIKFLYLGHIYKAKGIFDLIEIFFENKEKYSGKVELHIGGGMYEVNKLVEYISNHNLVSIIKFHGWVKGEKKISLLNACDVFILPSYAEGQPISILEAMSYSMPIISTPVGGIPDIVITEKNGILINPGNLSEIELAIDFFIEHPEKIEIYGLESTKIIKSHYPDSVINNLESMYSSLLLDTNC